MSIIGFQKAATTSMYMCGFIDSFIAIKYITQTLRRDEFIASNGTRMPMEASTNIVRAECRLAARLHRAVPWAKLVVSLREPISRAASMLIHVNDTASKGCVHQLGKLELGQCLGKQSQIQGHTDGTTSYGEALWSWLDAWPADQVHVVQYEELTDPESANAELVRLKEFLGVDLALPKCAKLTVSNSRRFRIRPKGWPVGRREYEGLLQLVKPDAEDVLNVLEEHGKLRDREGWAARWEGVWADNAQTCSGGRDGTCSVLLS